MSETTKEINKVTGVIIGVSGKLIAYAVAVLVLIGGIKAGYQFGYEMFYDTAVAEPPGIDMRVTIGEGEKLTDIAAALEENDLIKNRYMFLFQSIFYQYGVGENPVQAGTYLLNNSMSAKEIIITLRDGMEEEEAE